MNWLKGIDKMQIGGHSNIMEFHEQTVVKRATRPELVFYRQVQTLPAYTPFLCRVYAIGQDTITLENLLFGLESPSIVDVKPGPARVWEGFSL